MQYPVSAQVFYFPFDSFYNVDKFVNTIKNLEIFLEKTFTFSDEFFVIHSEFLKKIPYLFLISNPSLRNQIFAYICNHIVAY